MKQNLKTRTMWAYSLFIFSFLIQTWFLSFVFDLGLIAITINLLLVFFCIYRGIVLNAVLNEIARIEQNQKDIETFK